jgi:hypothetical protein
MKELIDGLSRHHGSSSSEPTLTRDAIRAYCPTIYGDRAISCVSPETKRLLELYVAGKLPVADFDSLHQGLFDAVLSNGQTWIGVERYVCEKLVESGLMPHYGLADLWRGVDKLARAYGKRMLAPESDIGNSIIKCVVEGTELPKDTIEDIFQLDAKASMMDFDVYSMVKQIVQGSMQQEDSSIVADTVDRIWTPIKARLRDKIYDCAVRYRQELAPNITYPIVR